MRTVCRGLAIGAPIVAILQTASAWRLSDGDWSVRHRSRALLVLDIKPDMLVDLYLRDQAEMSVRAMKTLALTGWRPSGATRLLSNRLALPAPEGGAERKNFSLACPI